MTSTKESPITNYVNRTNTKSPGGISFPPPPEDGDPPDRFGDDDDTDKPFFRPWIRQLFADLEILQVPKETIAFAQIVIGSIEWPEVRDPHVQLQISMFGQILLTFVDPLDPWRYGKRVDLHFDNKAPHLQFVRWAKGVKGDALGTTISHALIAQKLILWLYSPKPPTDIHV